MAVYTHISKDDLTQHLTHFSLGRLESFEGITEGVENTNYRITTGQGNFILTLFEKRTRAEDLPFFISFMEYLYGKGIPSPRILSAKGGEKTILLRERPSVITSFLEGGWPREILDSHIAAMGTTLAEMHLAVEKFPLRRDNALALPDWNKLIRQCGEKSEQVEKGLFEYLLQELEYLEKNRPQSLPAGAIHADLFPDNVFFKDGKLSGIIDFYFSCTDVFVYDLMLAINAWCFSAADDYARRTTLFLKTYKKIRPLGTEEQKALVFFGRAAAVRIIATRLYDFLHQVPGAQVKPKDPLEYVRILRHYQKGDVTP